MQGFIKTYSLWFDQPRIHETYLRTGAIYRWRLIAIWCQKVYLTSKSYIFHSCIFQRFTMSVVKNILIWEEWGHSIITLSQNALNLEPPIPLVRTCLILIAPTPSSNLQNLTSTPQWICGVNSEFL